MSIIEIVLVAGCVVAILGSIVSVVWAFSKCPSYHFCDTTYQRKDLHAQEYETLLEKIKELKDAIEELKDNK